MLGRDGIFGANDAIVWTNEQLKTAVRIKDRR